MVCIYLENKPVYCDPMMEGMRTHVGLHRADQQRPLPPANARKSFLFGYFSSESFLVLLGVTISLLVLPLILPPLPPPPLMLLLLPLGMIGVLLVLAFMPSDLRIAASSYL